MTEPARLVAPPTTGETRTLACARADSCHSGVLTPYPASEWQRPQFLAGLASLGAARRLTEQRDAMGVLPGCCRRIICPKSHHPRHSFSGFQSTDNPAGRNPDTLEGVVMTETGLACDEAAPLFTFVRKIDDVRHVVLHSLFPYADRSIKGDARCA